VGVASGRFSKEALRAAGADYVLDSLQEPLPVGPHTAEVQ